jgi:hypothetical protein
VRAGGDALVLAGRRAAPGDDPGDVAAVTASDVGDGDVLDRDAPHQVLEADRLHVLHRDIGVGDPWVQAVDAAVDRRDADAAAGVAERLAGGTGLAPRVAGLELCGALVEGLLHRHVQPGGSHDRQRRQDVELCAGALHRDDREPLEGTDREAGRAQEHEVAGGGDPREDDGGLDHIRGTGTRERRLQLLVDVRTAEKRTRRRMCADQEERCDEGRQQAGDDPPRHPNIVPGRAVYDNGPPGWLASPPDRADA